MNHQANKARLAGADPAAYDDRLTLRVINETAPSASPAPGPCLFYLVPLEHPRIRSTQARRLRLKDSLAGGSARHNASILAKDPHFWDYLQQINLMAYDAEIDSRRSRYFINRICNVGSRHELNRNETAARRFFDLIEKPFLDWLLAAETT